LAGRVERDLELRSHICQQITLRAAALIELKMVRRKSECEC
jgi:hypothetical protein